MSDPTTVTISIEEYTDLKNDAAFLEALRGAGVDNWDGWDYALEIYHDNNGDN